MPELLLETATLPPVLPDLEPVSWLISDHSNRERFLEELDPEQKIIAAEIFQSATRLEQCTGWDGETLVRCLGCPATTVGAFRDMKVERLEVSSGYLGLLQTLSALVETEVDTRMLVLGYGHIYRQASNDLNLVKTAFMTGDFSAFDFLQLGEVQTALDTALQAIDPAHGQTGRNPFDGRPPVHISTGRLDALIGGSEAELDVLGRYVVAGRMRTHIAECDGCGAAYAYRKQKLSEEAESFHSQGN